MRVAFVRADGRVSGVVVVGNPRDVKPPPGHTKVELSEGQFCVPNARYNGVSFTAPGANDDAPDLSLDARLALLESRVAELEARPSNGGNPNPPGQGGGGQQSSKP